MARTIQISADECITMVPIADAICSKLPEESKLKPVYADIDFIVRGSKTDDSTLAQIIYLNSDALITEGAFAPTDSNVNNWLRTSEIDSVVGVFNPALIPINSARSSMLPFGKSKMVGLFAPPTKTILLYDTNFKGVEETLILPIPSDVTYDVALIGAQHNTIALNASQSTLVRTLHIPYVYHVASYGLLQMATSVFVHTALSLIPETFATHTSSAYESVASIRVPGNTNYRLATGGRSLYPQKPNVVNDINHAYSVDVNTLTTDIIKVTLNETVDPPVLVESSVAVTLPAGGVYAGTHNVVAGVGYTCKNYLKELSIARKYGTPESVYDYTLTTFLSQAQDLRVDGGGVADLMLYMPSTVTKLERRSKAGALDTTFNLSAQYTPAPDGMLPTVNRRIQGEFANPPVMVLDAGGAAEILALDITHKVQSLSYKFTYMGVPSARPDVFDFNIGFPDYNNTYYIQSTLPTHYDVMRAFQEDFGLAVNDSVVFIPDTSCEPLLVTVSGAELVVMAGYRVTTYQADTGVTWATLTNGIYRATEPCIAVCGDTAGRLDNEHTPVNTGMNYAVLKPTSTTPRPASAWSSELDTEQHIEAQNGWTGGVVTSAGELLLCLEPGCCAAQFSMWKVSEAGGKLKLECVQNIPIADSEIHLNLAGAIPDIAVPTWVSSEVPVDVIIPSENVTIIDLTHTTTADEYMAPDFSLFEANYGYKMIAKTPEKDIYVGEVYLTNSQHSGRRVLPLRLNEQILRQVHTSSMQYHLVHPRNIQIHT